MIRTPSIIGSSLIVASLIWSEAAHAQVAQEGAPEQAPATAQTQAAPAAPDVTPPAASTRIAPAQTGAAQAAPAAATVPAPNQVKLAPVSSKSSAVTPEEDAANRELLEKLAAQPGGLTAEEVVQKALSNSPQLRKTELEANKAEANKARAKLAFAPRIDFMGNYTRLSNIKMQDFSAMLDPNWDGVPRYIDGNDPGPFGPYLNQWTAKASLSLPITDWFLTILPTYRGVSLIAEVSREQRRAQELQVAHDARIAFYDYAQARSGEAVALASVKVLDESVKDLEGLVQVGAATQTALARTRAARANAEAMVVQMQGMVKVTLERLSQITGESIPLERGIGEDLVSTELGNTPTFEQVVTDAKATRPELQALRTLHDARKLLARAKRGAVMPRISAGGAYTYANPNQRYIPLDDVFKGTWDVGVTVAWSPNDAAFAHTQVQDADSELRMVEEDLRAFEQGIAIESAAAVTGLQTAAADIAAKTEALEAARAYHADQRALMLAGTATPNDVLLAERDVTAAALAWVDSFVGARRAQANLLKAQGKTGLNQPGPKAAGSTP